RHQDTESLCNLDARTLALDASPAHDDVHPRCPSSQDGEDVVKGRTRRRSDDSDPSRKLREGTLPQRIEESLLGEAGSESLEGQPPQALLALPLEAADGELEIAPRLVEGQAPEGPDAHPLLGVGRESRGVAPPQDASQLRGGVLEGEVAVS